MTMVLISFWTLNKTKETESFFLDLLYHVFLPFYTTIPTFTALSFIMYMFCHYGFVL